MGADRKIRPEVKERPLQRDNRDHPEQYPTDKPSLFDMWESERNVDPIPVEDLKIEQEDERNKEKTKDSSSSENKYKPAGGDKS